MRFLGEKNMQKMCFWDQGSTPDQCIFRYENQNEN